MNPMRFDNEIDYYDRLIHKYQEMLTGLSSEEVQKFTSTEIIMLMQELQEKNSKSSDEKELMVNIVKNMLVLVLSLFEHRDESEQYKAYNELSTDEKSILLQQLTPMFN